MAEAYTFLVKVVKEDCLVTGISVKPFVLGFVKQRITVVFPYFAGFTYAGRTPDPDATEGVRTIAFNGGKLISS